MPYVNSGLGRYAKGKPTQALSRYSAGAPGKALGRYTKSGSLSRYVKGGGLKGLACPSCGLGTFGADGPLTESASLTLGWLGRLTGAGVAGWRAYNGNAKRGMIEGSVIGGGTSVVSTMLGPDLYYEGSNINTLAMVTSALSGAFYALLGTGIGYGIRALSTSKARG